MGDGSKLDQLALCHREAIDLAIRYRDEMDRYHSALVTLRELRSDHDGRPLVGNLQAREVIDRALQGEDGDAEGELCERLDATENLLHAGPRITTGRSVIVTRANDAVDAAFHVRFEDVVRIVGRGRAWGREREARRLVADALPRGFGWLIEHPRLVRAYFTLRPSKRPVLWERPTDTG